MGPQHLKTVRAGYREIKRVIRHGPGYPYRRYVAPARILKGIRVQTDEHGDITVCVLTSRYDWQMCLWALVSFYKFSGLRLPLLIYSDGSLKGHHTDGIRSVFPNARIVDPAAADAAVTDALAAFPNCRQFRLMQPCARRIIDFPILCKSRSILMLDSDILFFRKPEELVKQLNQDQSGSFVFERDVQHAYFASSDEIRERFGVEVSARANCGIMLADISHFRYELLEQWLKRADFAKHPWAEQTLWAMYAGEARTRFLSEPYNVTFSAEIEADTVMKHYIKPIRDYMYTDGIPHLDHCLEQGVQ